ncbi:cytochrome c [Pseudomonas sp. CCI3.2]|uniref:cytochrome c n=2 Tax=unclassified Pseudomonas TaxID=196821 RepID=UPI002B22CFF0|nr:MULTISPECIES: cytochrome c [unclassified Pseudomonas]MEB0168002.1 cytochrome c [Pseudomonas sp. CCC4.4]MEB0078295.1 cytochrome c [Pseudomonas sp. MH10out]MEB0092256.1 cytochrome c [Pseudomonas sp. CCI4.2]MEB0101749.1 cytochrome c [Pseudomonas sp. CCI3.2]MEB0132128.1 cytochrome c [Pseudomonas sp. CCI2.4]
MNVTRIAIATVFVVLCAGAGFWFASEPEMPVLSAAARQKPMVEIGPNVIQHGAQLVALADCAVCHSAKGGALLAGGLKLQTPFGAIYSTNITPDDETGIGTWSLDAFKRAMRNGVSRDGHLLYPAFAYQHFTRSRDADIADIYAYLMSRPPVHAIAPDNHLIFALNIRPLLAGWNLLFLHPGEVPADPAQSAEWNRGRYLVDGLGHCGACHSPLNLLGAEKAGQAFAGGSIDGWDAPALTRLSGAPVPWTQTQLVAYLQTGLASEHGAAAGPMRSVSRELAEAPRGDVEAMAAYLLSLQNPASPMRTAVEQANPVIAPSQQRAHALFVGACAACHEAGAPMSAMGGRPSLARGTAINADNPNNTVRMILDGNGWQGSDAAHFMPAFADSLTDTQIADLAHYLRARYSAQRPWNSVDETSVAKIRKETPTP